MPAVRPDASAHAYAYENQVGNAIRPSAAAHAYAYENQVGLAVRPSAAAHAYAYENQVISDSVLPRTWYWDGTQWVRAPWRWWDGTTWRQVL